MTRTCNKCGEEKPLIDFALSNQGRDGLHPWCRPCKSRGTREWYAKTRDVRRAVHRDKHLRRTYGLSADEYQQMLDSQGGTCALCRRPPKKHRLSIDHDHTSGHVRALLCNHCNRRRVCDHTLETARQLVAYLEEHAA